jgi:opine dehydrogenase
MPMFTSPHIAQTVPGSAYIGDVAIIGDGSRSVGLGSILSLAGHHVRLWLPEGDAPQECEIRQRQARVGHIRGKAAFQKVGNDVAAIAGGASCIILESPAIKYGGAIDLLGPYLSNGQTILLSNAPLGAALQFSHELGKIKDDVQVNIVEMGRLFDSVRIEAAVVLANGPRKAINFCGLSRNQTHRGLNVAGGLWMGLVPTSNVLERGFSEVERFLRPVLRLFRLINGSEDELTSLKSGLSAPLINLVRAVEKEVSQVARTFKLMVPGFSQLLRDYAGAPDSSLEEQILSIDQILMLNDLRLFEPYASTVEEIARETADTLVLLEEFARLGRVAVPTIDSIIELASTVCDRDLRKEGRKLGHLGLAGFDVQEIVEYVNA